MPNLHVHMRDPLLDAIDMEALDAGSSRSDWLREAITKLVDKEEVTERKGALVQVHVEVSNELIAKMRRYAEQTDLSMSEIARQAARQHLKGPTK